MNYLEPFELFLLSTVRGFVWESGDIEGTEKRNGSEELERMCKKVEQCVILAKNSHVFSLYFAPQELTIYVEDNAFE